MADATNSTSDSMTTTPGENDDFAPTHRHPNNEAVEAATAAGSTTTVLTEEVLSRYRTEIVHIIKWGESDLYSDYHYEVGDLTKVANQLKSKCSSSAGEDQWTRDVVEKVKLELLSDSRPSYYYDLKSIKKTGEHLMELVEVFPEFINLKIFDFYFIPTQRLFSPMELCFSMVFLDIEKILQLAANNNQKMKQRETLKTFELDYLGDHNPQLPGYILDTNCMEALAVVLPKVEIFVCSWKKWTKESLLKLIEILFVRTTTTVKKFHSNNSLLPLDAGMTNDPAFSQSIKELLTSLTTTNCRPCPIEEVHLRISPRGCPILPFLPHLHFLKILDIEIQPDENRASPDMVAWHHIQEVVARGRNLQSLSIVGMKNPVIISGVDNPPVGTFLSILKSTQNSRNLNKIYIALYRPDAPIRYVKVNADAKEALQECMVGVLQTNTTLTSVTIYDDDIPDLEWWSIAGCFQRHNIDDLQYLNWYLSHLNLYGRGKIQKEESTTALDLTNMLGAILDDYPNERDIKQTDLVYGLLRERPGIWIPKHSNHPKTTTKVAGKRKRHC